ncbi:MAG: hypothetical protein U9M94_01175 [Patescibacteria group bacterium]|nr:hypothetical protein [Patescibacteria group bacterium]
MKKILNIIKEFVKKKKEEKRVLLEKEKEEEKVVEETADIKKRYDSYKRFNGNMEIFQSEILKFAYSKESFVKFTQNLYNELLPSINKNNFDFFLKNLDQAKWLDGFCKDSNYEKFYLELGRKIVMDWFKRLRFSSFLFDQSTYVRGRDGYSKEVLAIAYIVENTKMSPKDLATEILDFYEINKENKVEEKPTYQYYYSPFSVKGYANPSLISFYWDDIHIHQVSYFNSSLIRERYVIPKKDRLEEIKDKLSSDSAYTDSYYLRNFLEFAEEYIRRLCEDQRYIRLRNKQILEEIVKKRTNLEGVRERSLTKANSMSREYVSAYRRSYCSTKKWLDHFIKNLSDLNITKEYFESLSKKSLEAHADAIIKALNNGAFSFYDYDPDGFLVSLLQKNKNYKDLARIYCILGQYDKEREMLEKI